MCVARAVGGGGGGVEMGHTGISKVWRKGLGGIFIKTRNSRNE